jgi:hypothetical protein
VCFAEVGPSQVGIPFFTSAEPGALGIFAVVWSDPSAHLGMKWMLVGIPPIAADSLRSPQIHRFFEP